MIYKNIFGGPTTTTPARVTYESTEFDFSEIMLENALMLEDSFYDITREHMMVTHLAIKDENLEILQEGLKDFATSAVEFFKKMLEKFKQFMSKVFMYFRAYLGNFEKFINKYKDKLTKLEPDFTIDGYNYSFSKALPNLDKIYNIVSDYNAQIQDVTKMTKEDLIKNREDFSASDNLDSIRATVIGQSRSISSEDFVAETKKSYRSGDDKEETIKVDKIRLQSAIDGYSDLKKVLNDCSKERDKVILLIENMKEFFSRSASVHYKDKDKVIYLHNVEVNDKKNGIKKTGHTETPHSGNQLEVINIFFNMKWLESKEFGSMAVTAMTEKVAALKEAMKLNETIIKRSLGSTVKKEVGGEN